MKLRHIRAHQNPKHLLPARRRLPNILAQVKTRQRRPRANIVLPRPRYRQHCSHMSQQTMRLHQQPLTAPRPRQKAQPRAHHSQVNHPTPTHCLIPQVARRWSSAHHPRSSHHTPTLFHIPQAARQSPPQSPLQRRTAQRQFKQAGPLSSSAHMPT